MNIMSYRNAAKNSGFPNIFLELKIKYLDHKGTCVPLPVLYAREEFELVKKEDILNGVQKFLTENPRSKTFKSNSPGYSWIKVKIFTLFRERNTE